jgi:methyl coenzyme M reductase beta subunit
VNLSHNSGETADARQIFHIVIEGCHGLLSLPESRCQVALDYANMPFIIAIATTIIAITRLHEIAISDRALARASALRDIFP